MKNKMLTKLVITAAIVLGVAHSANAYDPYYHNGYGYRHVIVHRDYYGAPVRYYGRGAYYDPYGTYVVPAPYYTPPPPPPVYVAPAPVLGVHVRF